MSNLDIHMSKLILEFETSPRGITDAIEFWLCRHISLRCYSIDHSRILLVTLEIIEDPLGTLEIIEDHLGTLGNIEDHLESLEIIWNH